MGEGLTIIEEVGTVTRYKFYLIKLFIWGITYKGAWVGGQKVLPLGRSGVITLQNTMPST